MKKLIALAALMVALPASAAWDTNKNGVPVLESFNDRGFFAMYQKHDGLDFVVLGRKYGDCSEGNDVIVDVNRVGVRFTYMCQYGYSYLKPKSEAGREHVVNSFLGQSVVNVEGSKFDSFGLDAFIKMNNSRIKNAL